MKRIHSLEVGAWLLCAAADLMAIRPLIGEVMVAGVQLPLALAVVSAALIAAGACGLGAASCAAAALVAVRPIAWTLLSRKTGPLAGEQAITVVGAVLQALGLLLLLRVARSRSGLSAARAAAGYVAVGLAVVCAVAMPFFGAAVVVAWASVAIASGVLATARTEGGSDPTQPGAAEPR